MGFSSDLKCTYINPTSILKATTKLMFVKFVKRAVRFLFLNPCSLGACLEQAVDIGDTKSTKIGWRIEMCWYILHLCCMWTLVHFLVDSCLKHRSQYHTCCKLTPMLMSLNWWGSPALIWYRDFSIISYLLVVFSTETGSLITTFCIDGWRDFILQTHGDVSLKTQCDRLLQAKSLLFVIHTITWPFLD